MKRRILMTGCAAVALTAAATWPEGYYDAMEGLSKERLKAAAKQCVENHTRLEYYSLPVYWQYTDIYPELVDGARRWWDMYSDELYLMRAGQTPNQSFSANKMQREHSVPKSWWKRNGDVEYTPAYTDLWNLYPSDPAANQAKSNYPFGICSSTVFDNGVSRIGPALSGQGGGSYYVFEPGDEYKGDFARTIFYMATVYDDLPWSINYMFTSASSWPTIRPWAYELLLQWARLDPVSQKEIDRNNAVESQQGNRNPFIDFPELAEYIWGTRTSEAFRLEDQGGQVTPPITGEPEIIQPLNGEALDFGQAAVGSTISRSLEIRGHNLTAPLSISVSGTDRRLFEVETDEIAPSQINATGRYLLNIFYTPQSVGEHSARLVLYDGGLPGGRSIAVQLLAEGCEVPHLSTLTALPPTHISDTEYVANWTAAPEVVDAYLVNRVRYLEEGQEGELIESDEPALLITGRDPSVAESYQVMSLRLGYRSEPSNTVIVAADSGVADTALPAATSLIEEKDGVRVSTALAATEITVYDLSGRIVTRQEARHGDLVALPRGQFLIITATGASRPFRILR